MHPTYPTKCAYVELLPSLPACLKSNARMISCPIGFVSPFTQGRTLVHFSAQLERFVWERGCA